MHRRTFLATVTAAAALALAACGSPPRVRTAPPPRLGESAGFPIYAMRLGSMDGAHGATAQVDLALEADGALRWRGEPAGRIDGRRVVDAQGREVLAVDADGAVSAPRLRRHLVVQPDGALLVNQGDKIYLDEAGRVVSDRTGSPPRWLYLRLDGWRPEAMRTGAMLVLVALFRTHQL